MCWARLFNPGGASYKTVVGHGVHRVSTVSLLLAGSGFATLVYQVAWMRSLRLVFGASTAATSAVLAIFMAGLGLGSLMLGKRADRSANPLRMYGLLEIGITATAALSPLLVELARVAYLAVGGRSAMGLAGSTVARLMLAAIVLGVPTFLMGGTLPAAVRAIEQASDDGRRRTGLLYGLNTLGAVAGAMTANFFALEAFGTSGTLWLACWLNALVATGALLLSRRAAAEPGAPAASDPARPTGSRRLVSVKFVLVSAAYVGFAFLAMELVWYRMLAPILGGSSYTFGLILAVVLLGIAIGGFLYSLGGMSRRPTMTAFAVTCGLEALFMMTPYALGDSVAVFAMHLRPLGNAGFWYLVTTWTLITMVVALPAAVISGYQFPLLVALLGRGDEDIGADLGNIYAWNTAGAIVGSLAGGFLLIPALSAPGSWVAISCGLALLSAAALLVHVREVGLTSRVVGPLIILGLTLTLFTSRGPTAAWRHSPIGAARMSQRFHGPNEVRNALQNRRRAIVWEADGSESSVALHGSDGYAFLIHGKSDGNARGDAATQVVGGLVGAALHPVPRRSLVIGLGTGSTGGWLARVPTMEHVDIVELERVIERVAEVCAPVNEGVLALPNVRVIYDDAREVLLTADDEYDLVFSEPSNPYRAGISSLFTSEFYAAVAERLTDDGIFMQWLQAYEVDARTVQTVYATLATVFPHVETWELQVDSDMLLVASLAPIDHDLVRLRETISSEPFDRALRLAWGVGGAEGFYAGYVAGPELSRSVASRDDAMVNTDDLNHIEFDFARNMGRRGLFTADSLRHLAARFGGARPAFSGGSIRWDMVQELRGARAVADEKQLADVKSSDPAASARHAARRAYSRGDLRGAWAAWSSQAEAPAMPIDVAMVAEASVSEGGPVHAAALTALGGLQPVASRVVVATDFARRGDIAAAARELAVAFEGYRTDPWPYRPMMARSLELAVQLATADTAAGRLLFEALREPFAVSVLGYMRVKIRLTIARKVDFPALCVEALQAFEPHVPWDRQFLSDRYVCYRRTGHALEGVARADLEEFLASEPPTVEEELGDPGR